MVEFQSLPDWTFYHDIYIEFHSVCPRIGNKFNQVSIAMDSLTTCLINSKYTFPLAILVISVIL